MYRIETQSTSSAPFSSLTEAQDAHIALAGKCDALVLPEQCEPATAKQAMIEIARLRRSIRAFEWRLAATGKVFADPAQRGLAQSLLDYWALRHVELRDKSGQLGRAFADRRRPPVRRPVSPRTLLPVDESIAESLAEKAERTYNELDSDAQRDAARDLFLSIAVPYGRTWVIDPAIAAQFSAAGVIVASGGAGPLRYSLAHDSVATQWSRMAQWMKDHRDFEVQFERVMANARNWNSGKYNDLLPRGEALRQAARFADRDPLISQYVEAAKRAGDDEDKRRKQFSRRLWTGFASVASLVAVAALFGGQRLASDSQEHATNEAVTASEAAAVEAENKKPGANAVSTLSAAPIDCAPAADAMGYIWIGSEGNPQVALPNGTPAEPNQVKQQDELAARAWINLREGKPADDGRNIAGDVKGTVSARSRIVALSNPESITVGDTAQYWLRVSLPSSVYIQVPDSGTGNIQAVVSRLKQANLQVPAVQQIKMPPGPNEVRYYYEQDAPRAAQVACLANRTLASAARDPIEVRSLVNTALAAKVSNGTIELWVFPYSERSNAQPSAARPTPRPNRDRGGQTVGNDR